MKKEGNLEVKKQGKLGGLVEVRGRELEEAKEERDGWKIREGKQEM